MATVGLSLAAGAITTFVPAAFLGRSTQQAPGRGDQRSMLAAIRWRCGISAIWSGLVAGTVYALVALALPFAVGDVIRAASAAAVVYGVAAAVHAGRTWLLFRTHHLILASVGSLPWRLWRFLGDAYDRQVARYSGAAWQFRHALLQDHLANRALNRVLRRRAGAGDSYAARHLARLLREQGEHDKAVTVLKRRAVAGDSFAALELVDLLREQGNLDEAVAVLQHSAYATDVTLTGLLAELLREQGNLDELRRRADAGDYYAALELAKLLREQGSLNELRRRTDAGDHHAASALAELLREQGSLNELRRRADAGDYYAALELAKLLREQGSGLRLTSR